MPRHDPEPSMSPTDPITWQREGPAIGQGYTPVGDYWIVPTAGHDMVPFLLHVTRQQLEGRHVQWWQHLPLGAVRDGFCADLARWS
jgi:hypothetical protein